MRDFSRADRLSAQLMRELSSLILDFGSKPADLLISIVEVEISKDLRYAKVFYSVLGDETASEKAETFFRDHYKQIRMELAGRMRIKFMPELKFQYDKSIERGLRISELLDRIKKDEEQQ